MIRYLFLITVLWLSYAGSADARKSYKAHVHGHATLALSIEKANTLEAQLVVDSASIYGFEYTPVKPEDKKKQKQGLEKLKDPAAQLFKFDPALACELVSATAVVIQESKPKKKVYGYSRRKAKKSSGEHSEVKANYVFKCKKPLKGTKLGFGFSDKFKGVQDPKKGKKGKKGKKARDPGGIRELKVIPLGQSHKTKVIKNDVGVVEL